MIERYVDIKGYEGFYQISNLGNVKTIGYVGSNASGVKQYIKREANMNVWDNGNGYKVVSLCKNGIRKNHYVHRLVAEHFLINTNNFKYINHIDYNKANNIVSNLEWCTAKENVDYSRAHYCKRKNSKTNTGYRYISYRESADVYRVTIDQKEYKSCKTLEEAVKLRDSILEKESEVTKSAESKNAK